MVLPCRAIPIFFISVLTKIEPALDQRLQVVLVFSFWCININIIINNDDDNDNDK